MASSSGDGGSGSYGDGGARAARSRALCEAAVRTLPIAGASLTLMTAGGHRGLVAATDDVVRRLDELQYTLGEGPAVDAYRRGYPVLASDLADGATANRWPAFAGAAIEAGAAAVFALPLQIGAIRLGVFVMYQHIASRLVGDDLSQALRLSDAAAYTMLDLNATTAHAASAGDAEAVEHNNDHHEQTEAYFLGAEVHQATGMLMIQLGVPIDVALARLRAFAFAQNRPVGEVARDVVAHGLLLER